MPTYPINKTYRGGFYNNRKDANGNDDRVYTAEDVRKPYDAVFTDGIKPDTDGTAGRVLAVTPAGGMGISIAAGHAKLGGAWFENTSAYNITLDNGTTYERYDWVILRNDDSPSVRAPSIYVKSSTVAPTESDLTRSGGIYELCIAYVRVPALATSITASNIVDTREEGYLCNVMAGAGAMVVRTFHNTYFSETVGQTVVPIGISQYDRSRDELTVIVNGRVFASGSQYTINSNSQITLAIGLPVIGTRIDFEVAKNVNAAGAETVVQEVAALREEMTAASKILEHHYYCNGVNDNVLLSEMAQTWINGGTDYGSMKVVVHGHFGATSPYSGDGTSARNYFWIAVGKDGVSTNRKIIFDFSDCTEISLPITAGTYNTVFSGNDAHIIGANVIASQSGTGTYIRVFSSASGVVVAEDCRFWITADITSYISQTGTFIRCRGSVTCNNASAYCFYPTDGALLRVQGGEYYAYAASAYTSAVVYQTAANAVAILYGVNCPTNARNGYVQSYAVNASGANVSITDTITALAVSVPNGNIRGTLAISKAGMM